MCVAGGLVETTAECLSDIQEIENIAGGGR